MCTPYQWTKQVASHYGGTRNGTIVHWPNAIKASGEVREQWHHVIDLAPTVLEVAGLHSRTRSTASPRSRCEGVSMAYTFDEAEAADRHVTQYFELMGNRGIYHEGWTAVTSTDAVGRGRRPPDFSVDVWELYDTTTDWTQAKNLAAEQPEKLAELQQRSSSRPCGTMCFRWTTARPSA